MRQGDHSKIYNWQHTNIEENILFQQSYLATTEIIEIGKLKDGNILVVGCSTSEVCGASIGSESRPEVAEHIVSGIQTACLEHNVYFAAQCCEHLNRALIIEKEVAIKYGYDIVNVVPVPKAGGSFATMAYSHFNEPVAVEHIHADAGLDIGDTLIGMHLKDVAVPIRLKILQIGEAHLVAARTRAKYIGGNRAQYDSRLA